MGATSRTPRPEATPDAEGGVLIVTTNPDHGLLLAEALFRQAPGIPVERVPPGRLAGHGSARVVAIVDDVPAREIERALEAVGRATRRVLLVAGPPRWTDAERRRAGIDEVLERRDPHRVAARLADLAAASVRADAGPVPARTGAEEDLLRRLDALAGHQQALARALRRAVSRGAGRVYADALLASLRRTRQVLAGALAQPPARPAGTAAAAGTRALVIDDDPSVAELAAEMLGLKGIEVVHAAGGREALGLIRSGCRCDVVLLDLEMPGLDGRETFRRLQEAAPDLPVILVTGSPHDPRVAALRDAGLTTVVRKPFGVRDLLAAVEQVLPHLARRGS